MALPQSTRSPSISSYSKVAFHVQEDEQNQEGSKPFIENHEDGFSLKNVSKPGLHVLFLCVANSCRSQMAAALCSNTFSNSGEAMFGYSAGIRPAKRMHPLAVSALKAIGIHHQDAPKSISSLLTSLPANFVFDAVVTVCGDDSREACPTFPRSRCRHFFHIPFNDPARSCPDQGPSVCASQCCPNNEDVTTAFPNFERTRDEIQQMIRQLPERMVMDDTDKEETKKEVMEQSATAVEVDSAEEKKSKDALNARDCCAVNNLVGAALATEEEQSAFQKLSFVDRYLTVWILGAMILGVLIGALDSSAADSLSSLSSGTTNIPLAIGLIIMMYPPLTAVKYEDILASVVTFFRQIRSSSSSDSTAASATARRVASLFLPSLAFNWFVGPLIMFFLGCATLFDSEGYLRGIVLMGLARCIAMVVVWNRLAGGSSEFTAALVLFNSVFQILFFSLYAYLFIGEFLPGIGLSSSIGVSFSIADVAQSVAIYLFIPFGLGICTRAIIIPWKGAKWFDERVKPIISPLTLLALLATIVLMFIMQGSEIVHLPLDILRISVPLFLYFIIMFFVALFGSHALLKSSVEESITLAFTSASNNFELAIAVAVAVFGIQSDEAFATVVGPLVEVPVMLGLVHAARAWAKKKRAQERLQQQASSSTELTAVAQMK